MKNQAEVEDNDRHWFEVTVPGLLEETKHIGAVIEGIRAIRGSKWSSPKARFDTLLAMWERQFQSLLLYAEGSDPEVGVVAFAALKERREAMKRIRERFRDRVRR